MVLHAKVCGRLGDRRHNIEKPAPKSGLFAFCGKMKPLCFRRAIFAMFRNYPIAGEAMVFSGGTYRSSGNDGISFGQIGRTITATSALPVSATTATDFQAGTSKIADVIGMPGTPSGNHGSTSGSAGHASRDYVTNLGGA
jgi:hypothetical protein